MFDLATRLAVAGTPETDPRALELLAAATSSIGRYTPAYIEAQPEFRRLRDNPRFQVLLEG